MRASRSRTESIRRTTTVANPRRDRGKRTRSLTPRSNTDGIREFIQGEGKSKSDARSKEPDAKGDCPPQRRSIRKRLDAGAKGKGEEGGRDGEDEDRNDSCNHGWRRWTAEEDGELRKRVRLHGEGNWGTILESSRILRGRYGWSSTAKAQDSIRMRWRSHRDARNDDADESRASSARSGADGGEEPVEGEEEPDDGEGVRAMDSPHGKKGWLRKEDEELLRGVRLHGEGNWKAILGGSPVLRERYKATSAHSAQGSIRSRYRRNLKALSADVELDSGRAQDEESCAPSKRLEKDGSKDSIHSEDVRVEEGGDRDNDRKCKAWSAEEDEELLKLCRLHEGNWRAVLDGSHLLQQRYKAASSDRSAMDSIKRRWERISKLTGRTNAKFDSDEREGNGFVLSSKAPAEAKPAASITSRKSDTVPREGWEDVKETRRSLLKTICDNTASQGDMVVVRIVQQEATARDALEHFFRAVPAILLEGVHQDRSIPADSLFVMLQLDSLSSDLDDDGTGLASDHAPWDIYAQANGGDADSTISFWAVDRTGSHVGKVEIPKRRGAQKSGF